MPGAEDRRTLSRRPRRGVVVLTCKDARIEPLSLLGLELGDAHVIRNAGGIATEDVLRSLAVSHHLLGTREVRVIGHTDCGMTTFTNADLRERIGPAAAGVDFLAFTDVDERVRESVRAIRESPLLPGSFAAGGYVYEVETGRLRAITP